MVEEKNILPEQEVSPEAFRPEEEKITSVEKEGVPEEKKEKKEVSKIEEKKEGEGAAQKGAIAPTEEKVTPKSPELMQIENIMSEGLEDIYLNMSKEKRGEFKTRGEEAAGKIEKLLQATKVNAKKVVDLIKNWLKIIPGVNKYFLEQESKIKADKIIKNKKQQ